MFTEKLKSCSFKPTMTQELGRTYRNEVTLKIRKDKNDDRLKKKRMEHTNMIVLNSSMLQYYLQQFDSPSLSEEDEIDIIQMIRPMLSHDESLIEVAVAGNYLNHLVANLTKSDGVDSLVLETLWALTNIASTQYTQQVITAGPIEPVISLLMSSTNQEIISQAAWFLGNCASDCDDLQSYLLEKGILQSV